MRSVRILLAGLLLVCPVPGLADTPVFDSWLSFETDLQPFHVINFDFDGDGDQDLVTANAISNSIVVLLNNGDGTFVKGPGFPTGGTPRFLTAADLDGDGDTDLAVANVISSDIAQIMNAGNGTFFAGKNCRVSTTSPPPPPTAVISADLDNDGSPELISTHKAISSVAVFCNGGGGGFQACANYRTAAGPQGLFAFDLNGDGFKDLAVADSISDSVSILINNRDGTFAPRVEYRTGVGAFYVHVADLDGDGDGDLAVANYTANTVSILKNNGNGTFNPLTRVDYPVGTNPSYIIARDLDSDGDQDLMVANLRGGSISVLLNNGSASFTVRADYLTSGLTASFVATDLDGDGITDIGATNFTFPRTGGVVNNVVTVLKGRGNGTFANGTTYAAGTDAVHVTGADFDNDTDIDLVVTNLVSQTVSVFRNLGGGVYGPKTDYVTRNIIGLDGNPSVTCIGDFDGDGDLDLAVANQSSSNVAILKNNGSGTFAATPGSIPLFPTSPEGLIPVNMTCADLDNDGDLDLVTANFNTSNIVVLKNDGLGNFTTRTGYFSGNLPNAVLAADLDKDGDMDLVSVNKGSNNTPNSNRVMLYRNDGTGNFAAYDSLVAGSNPNEVVAADLNGDTWPDLAVCNEGSEIVAGNSISVYLGDPGNPGRFGPRINYPTAQFPVSFCAVDFDADGDLDLVVADSNSSALSLLRNNGDGTFAPNFEQGGGRSPRSIFCANLDGDGDIDVVCANGGNVMTVFKNLTVPLTAQVPGDIDQDGLFTLTDIVMEMNCAFLGHGTASMHARADVNCNGRVSAVDVVLSLNAFYSAVPLPNCP